jgi:hypothetical protein
MSAPAICPGYDATAPPDCVPKGYLPSLSPVPGMIYPSSVVRSPLVLAATIRIPCALSSRAVSLPSAPYPNNPTVRPNVLRA